jgi:hypothetical protein
MQPHRLTHNAIQRDQRINPPHHHTGASGTSTHQGDLGRGDGNAAVVSPICAPPGNGGRERDVGIRGLVGVQLQCRKVIGVCRVGESVYPGLPTQRRERAVAQ